VTKFQGTEGEVPKSWFKYATLCLYVGRGAPFSPNTSHVIWKWAVNATLMMGHQPTRHTATNLIFFSEFSVNNILLNYFVTGEDDK
jgi:hypothetical protein